mmetsp:Transcript_126680/g.370129  ORF Transcript_126680/g.370129 Transcript_126680/m.370129 type:complete len:726 (-) Transcript_126680:71-2248(-)
MGSAALQSRPVFVTWPLQPPVTAHPSGLRQLHPAGFPAAAARARPVTDASATSCVALLAIGVLACHEGRADVRKGLSRRSASSRGRGFAMAEQSAAGSKTGGPLDALRRRSSAAFSATKYGKFAFGGRSNGRKNGDLATVLPAFQQWLVARGCKGVDAIQIVAGGQTGIQLRAGVDEGATVLSVPREAWISVSCNGLELDPEAELAWRLACEHWLGGDSDFAPYVDFLWSVDLSLHPVYWDDSEVAWLRASPGAHEEVLSVRQTISERVKDLLKRAAAPDSGVPEEVLAEPARLEADLCFALVLVESRATEADPLSADEPSSAAMVPLLDHLKHDPRESPSLNVGADDTVAGMPMVAVATAGLQAGEELQHCFEPVGNSQLLAHYGCVPEAAGDGLQERLLANAFGSVALPVRMTPALSAADSEACRGAKLRLLAERAGLDLRPGAPPADSRVELPRDLHAGGRLLPAARLLSTSATVEPGHTPEAACEALFARLFRGVGPGAPGPAPVLPVPTDGDDLVKEVVARATAWTWCDQHLKRYQKACKDVAKEIGAFLQFEGEESDPGEVSAGEEPETTVESIVFAHYKAKSGDQRNVKSKRPREARVLAVSDGHATVQFLSNGVRHLIPQDWIVGNSDEQLERDQLADKTHSDRGRLVMMLYSNEAALVEHAYNVTQNAAQLGTQIIEARSRGLADDEFELTSQFSRDWEREQQEAQEAADTLKEMQ